MQEALPGIWSIITPLIFTALMLGAILMFYVMLKTKGTESVEEVWKFKGEVAESKDKSMNV